MIGSSRFRPFLRPETRKNGRPKPPDKFASIHFSRNLFCAAKEIRELKSNPARRVPLRCGTQFALCLGLIVLRMTSKFAGVTTR